MKDFPVSPAPPSASPYDAPPRDGVRRGAQGGMKPRGAGSAVRKVRCLARWGRIKALWRRLRRSGFARALVATPFTSAFLSLGFEGLGYVLIYLAATFLVMVWLADNEKAKRGVNIAGNVAFLTYGAVMGYWVVIALNLAFIAWHVSVIVKLTSAAWRRPSSSHDRIGLQSPRE